MDKDFFTEDELLKAFEGRPAEQNSVYRKLYAAMKPVVDFHYYNNDDIGREIIQNSILKIFKRLDNIHYKAMFRYAKTTANNICIDSHRKKNTNEYKKSVSIDEGNVDVLSNSNNSYIRARAIKDTLTNPSDTSLYDGYDPDSVWERLNEAIDGLSPAYKKVFKMYYLDDLSVTEIAQRLDIAKGSVKSNLFKARHKVRVKLGSYEEVLEKDFEPALQIPN